MPCFLEMLPFISVPFCFHLLVLTTARYLRRSASLRYSIGAKAARQIIDSQLDVDSFTKAAAGTILRVRPGAGSCSQDELDCLEILICASIVGKWEPNDLPIYGPRLAMALNTGALIAMHPFGIKTITTCCLYLINHNAQMLAGSKMRR